MEFNKLIFQKLHPLFSKHGLKMTEQSKNIVKYECGDLVIMLSHDPMENSNVLWIGRGNFNKVEIDNQIIREYFNSNLEMSGLFLEMFVNNVFLFFMGDGEKLLKGNEHALIDLERFNERRSREYTQSLAMQQYLDAANQAWKNGNYRDVVKYIEMMDKDSLTEAFKQKYKLAQERLKE